MTSHPPPRESASAPVAPERPCECGCGTDLTGRRTNARYATDECRSRAWKARTGYVLSARRETVSERKARRHSGRQISYRRATTTLAHWIHLNWPTATNPTAIAEHVLQNALPERQRQHHERTLP